MCIGNTFTKYIPANRISHIEGSFLKIRRDSLVTRDLRALQDDALAASFTDVSMEPLQDFCSYLTSSDDGKYRSVPLDYSYIHRWHASIALGNYGIDPTGIFSLPCLLYPTNLADSSMYEIFN